MFQLLMEGLPPSYLKYKPHYRPVWNIIYDNRKGEIFIYGIVLFLSEQVNPTTKMATIYGKGNSIVETHSSTDQSKGIFLMWVT